MKSNTEILNEFGRLAIQDCFDPCMGNMDSLRKRSDPPEIFKDYVRLFQSISDEDYQILRRYLKENLRSLMFNFLRIFEEHQEFKIVYTHGEKEINLLDTSEMLKAEPIIENGWINKFSKQINNKE
ncbi:MAG TPA: hypothetical protein VF487_09930 [Chitinophagaceae bacterium]